MTRTVLIVGAGPRAQRFASTIEGHAELGLVVVGLLDDAQLGWRLHIFGQPTAGGEGFSLKSVEATAFCGRGVTEDGLCI